MCVEKVLLDLALTAGLAMDKAQAALSERPFRSAVDADWERSRILGITAVPTFIMGMQRLVGAQSYASLAQLVRDNR